MSCVTNKNTPTFFFPKNGRSVLHNTKKPVIDNCQSPAHPWCGWRDSNPHDSHHTDLNRARLPIPPQPHI